MSFESHNKTTEAFVAKANPCPEKHTVCDVIQLPALGRPFRLGMLYDRRVDMIIPGESLWSSDVLCDNTTTDEQQGCDFSLSIGESFKDKASPYRLNEEQKLSSMLGVSIFGSSGNNLNYKIVSHNEVQISMICNCYSHFKQFTLPTEVENLVTLENTDATHIVVGIKYGAKVAFLFERTVSDSEDKATVKKEMETKTKALFFNSNQETEKTQHDKTNKEHDEQISCKFSGDIILPANPTTYGEAVQLYKTLPSLIKKEKSAPVMVWLYPLSNFRRKEHETIHRLSSFNINRLQCIFENLDSIDVTCNDIMQTKVGKYIPEIQSKVMKFQGIVSLYRQIFQEKLSATLTDDIEDAKRARAAIILKHDMSPFAASHLDDWIKTMKTEVAMLSPYVDALFKVICDDSDLAVMKFNYDRVIVLRVVLPLCFEALLPKMESYIESWNPVNDGDIDEAPKEHNENLYKRKEERQPWYTDDKLLLRLRKCVKKFVRFSEEKENETLTCCAKVSFEDSVDSGQHVTMEYYQEGQLKTKSNKAVSPHDILA